MKNQTHIFISALAVLIIAPSIFAVPIDWHGKFGVSTNIIDSYRRIDSKVDNSGVNNGTAEVPFAAGQDESANWQNYLFRLEPHIIVNDTATIKAEFTSGYGRGGNIGDSTSPTGPNNTSFGNALYNNNVNSGGNDNLSFNKLYAEIYADTATYIIGRHTYNFGLGAVVNSGDGMWDRFPYLRDGVTVKINLGNFLLEPYWARQGDGTSLTKATRTKDSGISLKYDNVNRDMGFGVLYSKKKSGSQTDIQNGSSVSLGSTDVTLIDLYFKKSFEKFNFGLEIPVLSGEIGNVYGANTTYKTKAIIFQSKYKMNNSWNFGFDAGQVDGEDGEQGSYGAMYLNPNFQVANLLFRYNTRAIQNNNLNVYDSYINNTLYAKFYVDYMTERWKWNFAAIYARADQVAQGGNTQAYNHDTNKTFNSTLAQGDDMGFELDMSFDYNWNAEVSVGGRFGWLFTGDYFGYSNDSSVNNETANSYAVELNTMITF